VTALPRRQYRDPLDQLLEAEAETCKGCRFRTPERDGTARCRNPRVDQVLADKRCDEYQENA
jgi:hypothetical protein